MAVETPKNGGSSKSWWDMISTRHKSPVADVKPTPISFVVDADGQPKLETDGQREFYYATSLNKRNNKIQQFKIFVIDKNPQAENEFAPILSKDMSDYQFVGDKTGGSNDIGRFGGIYNFNYIVKSSLGNTPPTLDMLQQQPILFKQDTKNSDSAKPHIRHSKNIIEHVAGKLMSLFGGNSIATTILATRPRNPGEAPINDKNRLDADIYVGSVFFKNFQDLYKDINRLNNINPKGRNRPLSAGVLHRMWLLKGLTDAQTGECLYHDFERVLVASLLLGDYDVHSANLGVVAERDTTNSNDPNNFKQENGEPKRDAQGKIGTLKKIDHAGSMRNWCNDLHMNLWRFFYGKSYDESDYLPYTQPTNHFREYPRYLRTTPAFANELERVSQMEPGKIETTINSLIDEVSSLYSPQALLQFALRMGMNIGYDHKGNATNPLKNLFAHEPDVWEKIRSGLYAHPTTPAEEIAKVAATRTPAENKALRDQLSGRFNAAVAPAAAPLANSDSFNVVIPEMPQKEDYNSINNKLAAAIKQFCKDKMKSRLASAKQLSTDIKLSLCFKKVGRYFQLDTNSRYKVADILNENPEYIMHNKFRFRAPEQSGWGAWVNSYGFGHQGYLRSISMDEATKAALSLVQNAMIKRTSDVNATNYSVNFYQKNSPIMPPIPSSVYQMVMTKAELKENFFSYFWKQKTTSPTISTRVNNKHNMLKPDEYSLNFVDTPKAGAKAYYIESVTPTNDYQITIHRLPPELNQRYVFAEALLPVVNIHALSDTVLTDLFLKNSKGEIKDVLVIQDTVKLQLQNIAAKITFNAEDNSLNLDKLSADQHKTLFGLLAVTTEAEAINKMQYPIVSSYKAANLQKITVPGAGDMYIPSQHYLEFAKTYCHAMMLRNGPDTVIELLADPTITTGPYNVKDPLLMQAITLVCKKNNWVIRDFTNVPKFNNLDAIMLAAPNIPLAIDPPKSTAPTPAA